MHGIVQGSRSPLKGDGQDGASGGFVCYGVWISVVCGFVSPSCFKYVAHPVCICSALAYGVVSAVPPTQLLVVPTVYGSTLPFSTAEHL